VLRIDIAYTRFPSFLGFIYWLSSSEYEELDSDSYLLGVLSLFISLVTILLFLEELWYSLYPSEMNKLLSR